MNPRDLVVPAAVRDDFHLYTLSLLVLFTTRRIFERSSQVKLLYISELHLQLYLFVIAFVIKFIFMKCTGYLPQCIYHLNLKFSTAGMWPTASYFFSPYFAEVTWLDRLKFFSSPWYPFSCLLPFQFLRIARLWFSLDPNNVIYEFLIHFIVFIHL